MAITIGNIQSTEQSSGTTLTITKPTGVVDTDVLVAALSTSDDADTPTPPAGWTQMADATIGTTRRVTMWYRVVASAAGEGASYQWTSITSGRTSGMIARYSGVDNATPIDVTASSNSDTNVAASITTVTNGAMLVSAFGVNRTASSGTCTAPGTMTKQYEASGSGRDLAFADETFATAGATGTRTWTDTGTGQGVLLGALRPAGAGGGTEVFGTATASLGGTFSATGQPNTLGTASASLGGTFTANGVPDTHGTAVAAFGGTFTATGVDRSVGAATAALGGTFTANGVVSGAKTGSASADLGGTFTAAGVTTKVGQAAATLGGTFDAAGVVTTPPIEGSATATLGGTFTALGTVRVRGTASCTFGGTFAAAGVAETPTFIFKMPAYTVGQPTRNKLLRFYKQTVADSLVRRAGVLTQVRIPPSDWLVGAEGVDYFLGGRVYQITSATRDELVGLGYTVEE